MADHFFKGKYLLVEWELVYLFDLILYVPSTIFQLKYLDLYVLGDDPLIS